MDELEEGGSKFRGLIASRKAIWEASITEAIEDFNAEYDAAVEKLDNTKYYHNQHQVDELEKKRQEFNEQVETLKADFDDGMNLLTQDLSIIRAGVGELISQILSNFKQ